MRNAVKFNAKPMEYFTEKQLEDIHNASINILEELGTLVYHKDAVDILKQAGARIDGERVFIPESLVKTALESAPSKIIIYDRNGNPSMELEGRNSYYGTGSDCPNLLDSFTGERRKWKYKDNEDSVRLVDALPNINFTMSNGLVSDVKDDTSYQHEYAIMIKNSTKPQVITAGDKKSLDDIANIAAAVLGSRKKVSEKPIFVLYDEPTSPLVHSYEAIDKLLYMSENRFPTNYSPGMMAGATGPVTIAGSIVQANAEILTGLVIHQLKNPSAPFIFGAGMSPIDMRSMQPTYSAPEAMMSQAGLCQLGRELYKLPTWGFGGCGASKLADEQAVNEAATYILMAGLAGTNIIHDCGYLEFGLTFSYDMLVMCNEVIGQVRRMMEGINTSPEYLAVDSIKRVNAGGHYLMDNHTLDHYKENWEPGITDRNTHSNWKMLHGNTMKDRAKLKVKDIIKNHKPEPISEDSDKKINEILNSL